ncbi:MAG TPA: 3-deoxy-manno-octulosonate cytidylyltransferase [Caldimonas sp.]|jgi:3-deoxy-manno-octulosonate cytidylyltransferase (CMP-KDO synthetase)
MRFVVLIPARLASSRLPRKALADIGGVPMIVHVARRAAASKASRVVVAADDDEIVAACGAHGIAALLTSKDHASGSDRIAEASATLGLADDELVVNVQGDEPLIEPALIDACAELLAERDDCVMSTAAHAIVDRADFENPNIVKVVVDALGRALYFSRAPIPWPREAATSQLRSMPTAPLRHVGLYAYRAGFLRRFPRLSASPLEEIERLEQLRVLWHGERIAVHISALAPGVGVDTADDLEQARRLVVGAAGFA